MASIIEDTGSQLDFPHRQDYDGMRMLFGGM
jgi:hypothetical protein